MSIFAFPPQNGHFLRPFFLHGLLFADIVQVLSIIIFPV